MGRAMLSKTLIQFSTDGLGFAPSLLIVSPEVVQHWGLRSSMVGLIVTSRRTSGLLLPRPPCSWRATADPTPPQETLQHQQGGLVQYPVMPLLLSPGSLYTQDFVCVLQE